MIYHLLNVNMKVAAFNVKMPEYLSIIQKPIECIGKISMLFSKISFVN